MFLTISRHSPFTFLCSSERKQGAPPKEGERATSWETGDQPPSGLPPLLLCVALSKFLYLSELQVPYRKMRLTPKCLQL